MEFKDRQGQNLNRKKIKIISQTPTEIIADIERYDDATEEGTLINADVFNTFQAQIDQASIKASSALSNVNDANNKSDEAKINANEALTKAKTALSNSETAINKASQLENALADRGATVYVGEEAKSTIYFDADPQIQLNNKVEKAKSTLSTVSADDLFIIKKSNSSENYNISLNTLMTAVLNVSYPIGAVYISFNSTNPGDIFGGTWEAIQDKFLLCAGQTYIAGTSGGEASHILSTLELPSHSHNNTLNITATENEHMHTINSGSGKESNSCGLGYSYCFGIGGADNDKSEIVARSLSGKGTQLMNSAKPTISITYSLTNAETGNQQPHNNMPPYLAVYAWKRIG